MWIALALGSAIFAGLTSVLAKAGVQNVESNLATAVRTAVVLVLAWLIAAATGTLGTLGSLSPATWIFLVLSGLSTGGSWLAYFRALQLGDVNKVVPVDKSSIVLTVVFAFLFLGEKVTLAKVAGIAAIAVGTLFMVVPDKDVRNESGARVREPENVVATRRPERRSWLFYALLAAVFAAFTSILGKVGIEGVDSNLGTAIRTTVVLVLAWGIVVARGTAPQVRNISRFEGLMLVLSSLATGASWLLFYHALQIGPASGVVPVDKLSVVFAVAFAYFAFGEKLNRRSASGLVILVLGTMLMVL